MRDPGTGRNARRRGIVLVFSVIAVLLIAGLSSAFLTLSLHSNRAAAAQLTNSRAFHVAEAALDEAVLRITRRFNESTWDPTDLDSRFGELDAIDAPGDGQDTVFRDAATGALFQDFPMGPGTATVWVSSEAATIREPGGRAVGLARDLQVVSSGRVDGVTCSVQRNMRYQLSTTRRFEFAVLAKELPECMFCHFQAQGDVGQISSGEFKMWSPYDRYGFERTSLHGDLYLKGSFSSSSSETGGASNGLHQERMVTDQGGRILQSYTGEKLAEWAPLRPYFDPDGWYDALSRSGGASASFSQPPAANLAAALDEGKSFLAVVPRTELLSLTTASAERAGPVVDGHLVLIGTPQNPIRIDRSVTVHGDVVIRGTVSGVGNLNASGNIYIVDSVAYQTPPQDPRNAEAGAAGGAPADKLGLISASNVLVGDLTHPMTARFVHVQFVDVQGSGYEWVPAEYLNNRYALDGNRSLEPRQVGTRTVETPGLLPEGAAPGIYSPVNGLSYAGGWLPWAVLDRVSNSSLSRLDATIFADHAVAGGQPASAALITAVGGLLGRDIGILSARSNSASAFTVYHDNRNRTGNPLGFPPTSAVYETGWFRIPPRT